MDFVCHYDSPLGPMTVASDGNALTGLWFDGQRHFGSTLSAGGPEKPLPVFEQALRWLDTYFRGKPPEFTPPLNLRGTDFRKAVWEIMRSIPFGQTATYGEIARRLAERTGTGMISARAVGGAAGRNPILLIIPCHRVIGANGNLMGYAAGIERKKALLQMEKSGFPCA